MSSCVYSLLFLYNLANPFLPHRHDNKQNGPFLRKQLSTDLALLTGTFPQITAADNYQKNQESNPETPNLFDPVTHASIEYITSVIVGPSPHYKCLKRVIMLYVHCCICTNLNTSLLCCSHIVLLSVWKKARYFKRHMVHLIDQYMSLLQSRKENLKATLTTAIGANKIIQRIAKKRTREGRR